MSDQSRRSFLKLGCAAAAGAAVAGGINLVNVREAKAAPVSPGWGYPMGGLDVGLTQEFAYFGYKGASPYTSSANKECATGVFSAIIGQLQSAGINANYDGIPLEMMRWGHGGVADFASLCGAVNGACAAIGLICDKEDAKNYIADVLTYYSETALPVYVPAGKAAIVSTAAASNLCHVSVTNWCLASGYASGTSERSERCARLCADVAAFVVGMLNADVVPGLMGNPRDNSTICGACHYKGADYAGGQFTRGKMNCHSCHTDIEKASEQGHNWGKSK